MRRVTLLAATAAVVAVAVAPAAIAQTPAYPQRPVKLVVGFAAGGPSDLVARAFADHAARALGQQFIVENKPGANAVLAAESVALASPDGYTLLAAATNHTMIPALYGGRTKFDADKSFRPVCTLASSATVLVVGPSLPATSVADFLERVRAKGGQATYATPGLGSSPHLATERLRKLTGLSMVHVPYKGAAPAVTDLLGGQVDFSLATVGSVLPHLKAGKLRALAVASAQRSALLPQVPTFAEAGVKDFNVDTWYALLAPSAIPDGAWRALERESLAFGNSPLMQERLRAAGLEPQARCGEGFAVQIRSEIAGNTALAKELQLKPE
jgi:tripartite-type tricarboxylate transporter receptor subunit TctC